MSGLRLFLLISNGPDDVDVSVHREISTVHAVWDQSRSDDCVGFLHAGFFRPANPIFDELKPYLGKMIVSASIKWALLPQYKSSETKVFEITDSARLLPCYLALNCFGYEADESDVDCIASEQLSLIGESGGYSAAIVDAATKLLIAAQEPLNKEEIFSNLVEGELIPFYVKEPVSKLGAILNRYTSSSSYVDHCEKPLFGRTEDGKYYSIGFIPDQKDGWVYELRKENEELYGELVTRGVRDESTYLEKVGVLPEYLVDKASLLRFKFYRSMEPYLSFETMLHILPQKLLSVNVDYFGFSVRVKNILLGKSISKLSDLVGVDEERILKWPGFGRKSLHDLTDQVLKKIDQISTSSISLDESHEKVENPEKVHKNGNTKEIDRYPFSTIINEPLNVHYERSLSSLGDIARKVIEGRTGFNGNIFTLQDVAEVVGLTRERVRQIQNKCVEKIIETEYWDDAIAIKIGQLLVDRAEPLYLEMLEIEDPWFSGFFDNYQNLAGIIETFTESQIRVIKIAGASVVTRIANDAWLGLVRDFRHTLKDKSEQGSWTRDDISMSFKARLSEFGASELFSLLWREFSENMLFSGEGENAKLISFGKSMESAVSSVLNQAEKPLHFSEIAVRATEILGREVDERRAHQCAQAQGAKLFGRGIYGQERFNPISERMQKNILLVVTKMILDGPLMKQWHASEILNKLNTQFPSLPNELDAYVLNIILGHSDQLVFLNRMIWARADSGQSVSDRVDMADAFIRILEDNGGPLKGRELKLRLSKVRGVPDSLQIQPTERLIQVGPDFWGLVERDIGGTEIEIQKRLDFLYATLKSSQQGLHVKEVEAALKEGGFSTDEAPTSYALLNVAQRDERFYLGRAMYLGLSEWGNDTRRLNISQAVRLLVETEKTPLEMSEVVKKVEALTGLKVESPLNNALMNEGAVYDSERKMWIFGVLNNSFQ